MENGEESRKRNAKRGLNRLFHDEMENKHPLPTHGQNPRMDQSFMIELGPYGPGQMAVRLLPMTVTYNILHILHTTHIHTYKP